MCKRLTILFVRWGRTERVSSSELIIIDVYWPLGKNDCWHIVVMSIGPICIVAHVFSKVVVSWVRLLIHGFLEKQRLYCYIHFETACFLSSEDEKNNRWMRQKTRSTSLSLCREKVWISTVFVWKTDVLHSWLIKAEEATQSINFSEKWKKIQDSSGRPML